MNLWIFNTLTELNLKKCIFVEFSVQIDVQIDAKILLKRRKVAVSVMKRVVLKRAAQHRKSFRNSRHLVVICQWSFRFTFGGDLVNRSNFQCVFN